MPRKEYYAYAYEFIIFMPQNDLIYILVSPLKHFSLGKSDDPICY